MVCPNINTQDWKDLVNAVGKRDAYSIFINNGYRIPDKGVISYLAQAKVSEKELNWIKGKLPEGLDISMFDVMIRQSSYGDQYIWGQFKNNVLNLSRLAEAGTGYHEYFHGIFRNYFPQEEIDGYLQMAANEIDNMLDRQGKSVNQYLQEKMSDFVDTGLTIEDKLNLIYEEYLADHFAKYMRQKEHNTVFGKIFDSLKRLIQFIFQNQRQLDLLFHKVANQDFKSQRIAMNKYQEGYLQDSAYSRLIYKEPVFDPEGNLVTRTFGVEESQQIVRDLTKMYYNAKNAYSAKGLEYSPEKILDDAVNLMQQYAIENNSDLAWTLGKTEEGSYIVDDIENITEREYIKNEVKSMIKSISPYFSFNEDKEVDPETQDVNENDDPVSAAEDDQENLSPRDDSFGKESSEKQGWSRLPQFLREYISTVSYLEKDADGDPILIGNLPLSDGSFLPIYKEKNIDVNKIYFSLTRSLIDTPNDITRLVKMFEISRSNTNQRAFVDKFIRDSNLDISRLDEMEKGQRYISRRPDGGFTLADTILIQSVLKGFDKYTQDPLMMSVSPASRKVSVALANRNKADIIFYDQWQTNFEAVMFAGGKFNDAVWKSVFANRANITSMLEPAAFKGPQKTLEDALKVQAELSKLGIDLSASFIEHSILSNLKRTGKLKGTPEDIAAINKVARVKLPSENILNRKAITMLFNSIEGSQNPFERVDETDEAASKVTNAIPTIQGLAKGNVKFDEAAYETSYIATDGTIRYGHQDATLHLTEINKMNDMAYLERVFATGIRNEAKGTWINGKFYTTELEDAIFRQSSYFNSPTNAVRRLLNDGQDVSFILRPIDGIKEEYIGTNDEGQTRRITFVKKGESVGTHFGDMSDRDYATFMFNLMVQSYENQDIIDKNTGQIVERVFMSPVTLGMMETSKTHHMLYLPALQHVFDQKGMTQKGINLLVDEVAKEYDRIKRVAQKLAPNGEFINMDQAEALQAEGELPFIYSNYHHKKGDFSKGRALEFSDHISGFMSPDMQKLLSQAGIDQRDLSELRADLEADLVNQFNNIIDAHLTEFEEMGLTYKTKDGKIKSELLSPLLFWNKEVVEENDENKKTNKIKLLNYTGMHNGFRNNIGHLVLQQAINSINALHIINGDPALMYKNDGIGTDFYKRMKTSNGAGLSASHSHNFMDKPDGFQTFNAVVLQEPTVASKFNVNEKGEGDSVDVADAQMYMNLKSLKHVLLGLGKLSEKTADLIVNKIEKGIPLKTDELFDHGVVIEQDRFINSFKFIFRDNNTTFKISAFILTPNLVQTNIGTEENPDWRPSKDRADLYEIYSLMNDKNVDFVVYETGTKTMTTNVVRRNKDGKYDRDKIFPITYDANYLRLQLENPTNKTSITSPTQLLQQVDTEQELDKDGYIGGVKMKLSEVRDKYNDALRDKHNMNYMIARNSMYTIDSMTRDIEDSIKTGKIVPRLAAFQKKAVKGLLESGADSQLVDFFRLRKDEDGNEVPKFDLNNPKTIEKFANLWYASLSKGVFSMKNKGFAAALVSSNGFTPIKKITGINEDGTVTWKVVRKDSKTYKELHKDNDLVIPQISWANEKTFQALQINGRTVEELRQDLAEGKEIFFKDRLQYGVPRYQNGEITGYFAEVLFTNHYPDFQDNVDEELPEEIRYMFGNRIPLQDKHSMMNFEAVDYLPQEFGSSLVAPQEIVEFSGADYDIDKVYITAPPVYMAKGKPYNYTLNADIKTRFAEYKRYMFEEVKEVKKRFNRGQKIDQILGDLGLPKTLEEYEAYVKDNGEINNGINERIIFEAMTTLYSNQSMVDRGIPMAPANQEKLKAIQKMEQTADDNSPYFKNENGEYFNRKKTNPALSLLQLIRAKRANNVGKDNIGIIVNLNKVFTTLNKAGITIPNESEKIYYNGKVYDNFSGWTTDDGQRKIDYLSTLTSAATDENKDGNCAKFGLGTEEMAVVGILIGLGIPMADAVGIVNQPIVKAYTAQLATASHGLKKQGEESWFNKDEQMENAFKAIGLSDMYEPNAVVTPKRISEMLLGDRTGDYPAQQATVLALFMKAQEHVKVASAVAAIMKLTNGLDYTSIDKVKRAKDTLKISKPNEEEVFQGLRYAMTGDPRFKVGDNKSLYVNELAAANLENLAEIEKLNDVTFLTNSPAFQRVLKTLPSVYRNASPENKRQFEKDLLSYLTLQVYKAIHYSGENANPNFRTGFVYDVPNEQSIVDQFNKIKAKIVTDPKYAHLKDNVLMAQLIAKNAKPVGKKKNGNDKEGPLGIYTLITRTTSKKNELQQGQMTLGFYELLQDPLTEDFAKSLFDLEFVKDGLQFQFQTVGTMFPIDIYQDALGFTGSALSFVRKFINARSVDNYLEVLDEMEMYGIDTRSIPDNLKKNEYRDRISQLMFGKSFEDFIDRFYELKFTHPKSFKGIKEMDLDRKLVFAKNSPYRFNPNNGIITINKDAGTFGMTKEVSQSIRDSNEVALKDAKFYNGEGELSFPRYMKARVQLFGKEQTFLFRRKQNEQLRVTLRTLQEELEGHKNDYTLDEGDKFFNNQIIEELEAEIKEIKLQMNKEVFYELAQVVGSPRVAPWLDPSGIVPIATTYREQASYVERIMGKQKAAPEVFNPKEFISMDDAMAEEADLMIQHMKEMAEYEDKAAKEYKGAIESSLSQETKDILNIPTDKLEYGTSIDEIIKNNKCK